MRLVATLLFCVLNALSLTAQESAHVPFECRWAGGPIRVDGKGDEAAWQQAQRIDRFAQPWLKENAQPLKTATKARLLWDRDYLYFLAELEDHDLFADITEHDGRTWLNDVFEMFFRPDDTKPAYYELQANAAGTMLDIYFARKGLAFDEAKQDGEFRWQAAVERRGTLDNRSDRDEGWSVEGRIPWSDFARTGGRPAAGDVWRVNLCRYDYTLGEKPELSTCSPLSQPSFHLLEDYARLKFVGKQIGQDETPRARLPKKAFVSTSKVIGSPDPPLPYRPVRAYRSLKLSFPISLDRIPGTDQMLVIVQGKPYGSAEVLRFTDDAAVSSAESVLTIPDSGTAYGIAFHPRFAENGYLYIGWNAGQQGAKQTMVTRYTMDRARAKIDPESALTIIAWDSNGHNGGDVEFGTDGMLYVTSGDGTSDSDTNLRGQDLTQLTSKVLRIDVDRPGGTGFQPEKRGTGFQPVNHGQDGRATDGRATDGRATDGRATDGRATDGRATPAKNYSIPPDNPFVGVKGVVPETWAYGLRNPWRIAVDPRTGHIWVGNNGQDLWEQVYFVRKGDNLGWSVYEGGHIFYADRKMGPEPLALPAADHHHSEARSMTGGVVYYGQKLPELSGAYIYGDHSTGRIWGIKHDGQRVTWHKLLADTTFNITGFAIDKHGELLVADHRGTGEGGYYYLEPTPKDASPVAFPRRLSESGLFTFRTPHAPREDLIGRSAMSTVPGVIPFSVNSPLWSDGAYKERYLAIPEHAASEAQIDLNVKSGWNLPEGTVLIKSFALDLVAGDPTSRRWIETRFLTKQGGEWAGYSYVWNDEQTDAELVAAEGMDREYEIRSAGSQQGDRAIHKQKWRFPSRVECMVCHSRAANFVLGPSTAQMNREHDYGGVVENQLRVLDQLGLIKRQGDKRQGEKPIDPARYPHLADPYDESQPLEARARSYLHANCSICHTSAGGGNAQINLEHTGPLKRLNAIDVAPLHHKFGLADARLIAPGHPERSVLLYRMAHRGEASGQMPQFATNLVDQAAVKMMAAWIRSLEPLEP